MAYAYSMADRSQFLILETVWRIPIDVNVVPLPPLIRKLRLQDILVLNNRRAGTRGRAHKTG